MRYEIALRRRLIRWCVLGCLVLVASGCGTSSTARHEMAMPEMDMTHSAVPTESQPTSMPASMGMMDMQDLPVVAASVEGGETILSGSGEGESEPFTLHAGPVVFRVEHATATFFSAFLLNANGDHLAVLANAASPINGPQMIGNDAEGSYHLHVIAEDSWKVAVSQPADVASTLNPASSTPFAGEGLAIVPLTLKSGKSNITWEHSGTYPLLLTLLTTDGRSIGRAVYNGGTPSGTATFDVAEDGAYLLNIQADGHWSMELVAVH